MTYKFAVFSGITNKLLACHEMTSINLVDYTETYKEADDLFEKSDTESVKWIQILCLTTFIILKSSMKYEIAQSIDTGYHSDEYYN